MIHKRIVGDRPIMILINQKYRAAGGDSLNGSMIPEWNLQNGLAGLPRQRQQLPVWDSRIIAGSIW
jgi:hypothetical protein